jgi:hypothetical protein
MHVLLERRSDFRPTRTRGVVGQKWRTSGYHWRLSVWGLAYAAFAQDLTLSMTFSSELGQSIAKQTKRRSVSG